MPKDELDSEEQRVVDDIARWGWHAVQVTDDEPSAFTYSIGFMQTLDHPELIMFGLDVQLMHSVLWTMYRDIERQRRFDEPLLYEDVVEGYAITTRPVHQSWHERYLGYAMWHRRHVGRTRTLTAVQVIWPDRDGRFPTESDCHPAIAALQPRLDLPMPTSTARNPRSSE